MNTLLLASQSYSRALLLQKAKIPFTVIGQTADEHQCDWGLPLEELVLSIAQYKMQHARLPVCQEGDTVFVLTADTLTQDRAGVVYGKPANYQAAVDTIKALQAGSRVSTAFCLEKKQFMQGVWQVIDLRQEVVSADCLFDIPDRWIDTYLQTEPLALKAAGSMVIEEYGLQFLKTINGSYSTIMGLPLCEVRQALETLGFFRQSV